MPNNDRTLFGNKCQ